MLQLGVNIDHVATLREARYRGFEEGEPSPVEAARIALEAGAHGITAHLREDRRHIIDRDVRALRDVITTRFNFEMANAPEIIDIALGIKPEIVCLVPEKREEVTTEGGLDVVSQFDAVKESIKRMNDTGIDVSLFIVPDRPQIEAAARSGAQFVELHTGMFAEAFRKDGSGKVEVDRLSDGAILANALGLNVNAGHGLNLANLRSIFEVPYLQELNIGHSIVSRAVFVGLEQAVKEMLELMAEYPHP
jgi:pyridoxine 5-phosphate synthase